MISNQIIQTSIEDLKNITKVELYVADTDGNTVASTFTEDISEKIVKDFMNSPADSQIIGDFHMFKINDENEVVYVLVAKSSGADAYMIGKVAVSQIQGLIVAYKEHYNKNTFFQNLILDNLLLVDIYNRAKKLHIETESPWVVYLVETAGDADNISMELLKNIFTEYNNCYITAVEQKNIILIKELEKKDDYSDVESTAKIIVDMLNSEAMLAAKVSYGTIVNGLKEVSKSYKEATMAMDVGKIFYSEKSIIPYNTLGIGRLIYQLPVNLCKIFIQEILGDKSLDEVDDEIITTVQKFFDNNLNVSETSRQLFIHRNTLVYRIEKLNQATGLDVRTFEDALTFKILLMVSNYLKYLDNEE